MEHREKRFQDYLVVMNRRARYILVTTAVLFAALVFVVFSLPSIYRSSATILIEDPDVSSELINSTVSSYADQRLQGLQVITQQVMTVQNLIEIIDRLGLYPAEGEQIPDYLLAEQFRENIEMDLVMADIIEPRTGRQLTATIAFTLSFLDPVPQTAQRALEEVVGLFLNENTRARKRRASESKDFLANEAQKLRLQTRQLEEEIAEFKRLYAGSLPEQLPFNLQLLNSTQQEVRNLDLRGEPLRERISELQSRLVQTSPFADGSDPDQLAGMQTELRRLRGIYGPKHPKIIKLTREIEELSGRTEVPSDTDQLQLEADRLRNQLQEFDNTNTAQLPRIVAVRQELESVERLLDRAREASTATLFEQAPTNPIYLQLNTQLGAAESELALLQSQRTDLEASLATYQERIYRTPKVEKDYLRLTRDYESLIAEYEEIKSKQTTAQLTETLESEKKAGRYSVIEPPQLPFDPVKPKRMILLLIGFVLSVGAGVGAGALAEGLDQSVYGAKQLTELARARPLVVVPVIRNRADGKRLWRNRFATLVGVSAATGLFLLLFNEYAMPLDVLVSKFGQRLGLS